MEEARHHDIAASDTAIPTRGSRFKEELPTAHTSLPSQGHFREDLLAADEDGTHSIDVGLCIFAPRVAKDCERRKVLSSDSCYPLQVEQSRSQPEPRDKQRQREIKRTLSQEQMPPPPRPRNTHPSRISKRGRKDDDSQRESTGVSQVRIASTPGPHGPQVSGFNGEPDSQVKSLRHRRIQDRVRRNLGLKQTTSRGDDSDRANDLPESSASRLPGIVELCNAAHINMVLKNPCANMIALAQQAGSPPDQSLPSTPLKPKAAMFQPFEESSAEQQASTGPQERREPWTASSVLKSPSPPVQPCPLLTEKTYSLAELQHFYQVGELHTITTGPATFYSCVTPNAELEASVLAYPTFILLHAGKKYPEWPSLFFSSTDDTEEEFGCIHSLPRVHSDRQLDAVPVFEEVTWSIRESSARDLKEIERKKKGSPTATGSVSEGVATPARNPGTSRSAEAGKRATNAAQSRRSSEDWIEECERRVASTALLEDSDEDTNGRDLDKMRPEQVLEGRRATFLGWYDILGVRYHERRPQALDDQIRRTLHEFQIGVRVHPTSQGSTTLQVSAKVAENHETLSRSKEQFWENDRVPPEGPTADASPIERSYAATPGRMSAPGPPPPWTWDPSRPDTRTKVFELSEYLEARRARASAQSASSTPPPSSCRQSGNPEPPIPFTANIKEKECWTLIWGEAFVDVTLTPASPRSLGRVVDMHGEESLTDPLTWRYKRSVTVAEDGLSCEIQGTAAPDGDAVYDTLGRRFERACAVHSNSSRSADGSGSTNSGGANAVDAGQSGESQASVNKKMDFSNPYAGTEYRRRRGIKKRWSRNWGQEDDLHQVDKVAVGESSADALKNAEDHDGGDYHQSDDTAVGEESSTAADVENPVPPNFKFHPSISFTVPAVMTSAGIDALGVTKVQRIVRHATTLDLQHIQECMRNMCRQQLHRKTIDRWSTQQRRASRQRRQQVRRRGRRQLDHLREMVAGGQVEANWLGVWEAVQKMRPALRRTASSVTLAEGSVGEGGMEEREKHQGKGTDIQEEAAPDQEEWPDTTGPTPLTQEESDKGPGPGEFWMSW